MKTKTEEQEVEEEWLAAEAALAAAQKLPDGPERIKALKGPVNSDMKPICEGARLRPDLIEQDMLSAG